jgi:hypothetical protein
MCAVLIISYKQLLLIIIITSSITKMENCDCDNNKIDIVVKPIIPISPSNIVVADKKYDWCKNVIASADFYVGGTKIEHDDD